MKIADAILDFIYPRNAACVGCGDVSGAEHDGLCADCLRQMERLRIVDGTGRCPRCMTALRHGECPNCQMMGEAIHRETYAFPYASPASDVVKQFKYGGEGRLDDWMAEQMLRAPHADELLHDCDLLVCAPADRFRKARRGYNQAYLLAKALSRRTGIPAADALKRRPFVKPQVRLKGEERLENLSGVVYCRKRFDGQRILLVDDVRTTGATAAACAKVLMNAGAAQVDLLTFAGSDDRKK